MNSLQEYLLSGVLEAYVNGRLDNDQQAEVEQMVSMHPAVRHRVDQLSSNLEEKVTGLAIAPPKGLKAVVLASIDYMDRMSRGEPPAFPPALHEGSTASDYEEWLNRKDFISPGPVKDMYIRIIGMTPSITTAIVWMQEMQTETHTREIEKFLIIEGSCEVFIGKSVHRLKAGDLMTIPTHQTHRALATSSMPCKIVLQRIAV